MGGSVVHDDYFQRDQKTTIDDNDNFVSVDEEYHKLSIDKVETVKTNTSTKTSEEETKKLIWKMSIEI